MVCVAGPAAAVFPARFRLVFAFHLCLRTLCGFAGGFFFASIDAVYIMFDAGLFLGFFSVVPAVQSAHKIAGDAAEAFKWYVTLDAAAGWAAIARDDTGEATDWVAVYWMVDGTVANATIVHFADDGFESLNIVGWVAVELDVANVPSIAEIMVWRFDFDFVESGDWIINWYMERVSVELAVVDAFDFAEFFAIHLGEAASKTFGWGGKQREVELVFLAIFVATLAHMGDDVETEFARSFVFAVVFAGHGDESFGETNEADREGAVLDNITQSVAWFELFGAKPVPLPHQEWEFADVLVGLEFEALEELVSDQIHDTVEVFVEGLPVGFFAFV